MLFELRYCELGYLSIELADESYNKVVFEDDRVDLYRSLDDGSGWEDEPWATADTFQFLIEDLHYRFKDNPGFKER